MATAREFLFSFLGKETVSSVSKKAADGIENLGDRMSDTERDAARLDKQIADVEASLKDLATQYARTGDNSFVTQIRAQERELRKLSKVRVHLGDMFDPGDAAQAGVSIAARMGPVIVKNLPAALTAGGGVGAAVGAPLIAGLATVLGSAAVGAVIGGSAAGAVAAGIKIASKDSRVQSEAKSLSDAIGAQLEDSAAPFVPATLKAISTVRRGFRDLDNDLDDIFGDSAGYVRPFTEGIMGFVREAVPGFRDIVRAAGPVVAVFRNQLPELGRKIGETLSGLSEHGQSAARALAIVFEVVGASIKTVGHALEVAATGFKFIDVASAALLQGGAGVAQRMADYSTAAENADKETDGWAGAIRKLGEESSSTAVEIRSLSDAIDEIITGNLSLVDATIAAEEAIDSATETIKENGKNINDNTQAGRENISALTGMAEAFNRETAAADKSGQTSAQASQMHKRHADALYAAARAAGHTESSARSLVAQWLKVPRNVSTKVSQTGADAVKRAIAGIPRHIAVAVRLTGNTNISAVSAALRKNQRWGGIDYAMASGGAIEAHHATSPTVLYGERETGGEAFIPRNGNRARSTQILEKAAGWYGLAVGKPGRYAMAAHPGMDGGSVQRVQVELLVRSDSSASRSVMQEIVRGLRYEVVNTYGGRVERALVTG